MKQLTMPDWMPNQVPVGLITIFQPQRFGVDFTSLTPREPTRDDRNERFRWVARQIGVPFIEQELKGREVVHVGYNLMWGVSEAERIPPLTIPGGDIAHSLRLPMCVIEAIRVTGDPRTRGKTSRDKLEARLYLKTEYYAVCQGPRAPSILCEHEKQALADTIAKQRISLRSCWVNPIIPPDVIAEILQDPERRIQPSELQYEANIVVGPQLDELSRKAPLIYYIPLDTNNQLMTREFRNFVVQTRT